MRSYPKFIFLIVLLICCDSSFAQVQQDTVLWQNYIGYNERYVPDSMNDQPRALYLDKDTLLRKKDSEALFNGIIIDPSPDLTPAEYFNRKKAFKDTAFYYFNAGVLVDKKVIKYEGVDDNRFDQKIDHYFLIAVHYDQDSSFQYNEAGDVLLESRTTFLNHVGASDSLRKKVIIRDYSSHIANFFEIYEKHYYGEYGIRLWTKETTVSRGDTTNISYYSYKNGERRIFATHTHFDHFGDTVSYSETLNNKRTGRALYVEQIFIGDSMVKIQIKSRWNNDVLNEISAERAIFMNEQNEIISNTEFPESFMKTMRAHNNSRNLSITPMNMLTRAIPFEGDTLPSNGPLIFIKYGRVENPLAVYAEYMKSQ